MALVLADRVQQTGTANTTVSFTLTGSVTGFQSFSVIGNGNTTFYSATDTSGNWEVGLGTYSTTGPTLTRTSIFSSSNSGSAVTFSGAVTVFVTYPSGKSVNLDGSGNVSALGTVSSGVWQGTTVGVAYGGTGVTTSSGANSVVLRDANQNIDVNRLNQANTSTTAAGGTTTLTAASSYSQTLNGTGGQTYKMPDATTLTTGVAFVFNNNATGTLTLQNNAATTIGTITSGGAVELVLLDNGTVGGTWDVHGFLPEDVTWGTNALALGSTVITGGTWNGGTITSAYGGTGLTTFVGANNALYSTSSSALAAGTLPVAAGGTGQSTFTNGQILIGNTTGNTLTKSTLTAGSNITITNGNGSITIAAAGASCATPSAAGVVYGRSTNLCAGTKTALGYFAGNSSQSCNTVAIGSQAGFNNQSIGAVAVGKSAGSTSQGSCTVAIGNQAASQTQGANAVAVGAGAAGFLQGANAIAIGKNAGGSFQAACSIAIGASVAAPNAGLYVAPIRNKCVAGVTCGQSVLYCTTSKELVYGAGGVSAATPTTLGTVYGSTTAASTYKVALGYCAGAGVGNNSIAIGRFSAACGQGVCAIAIGKSAGVSTQGCKAIGIGFQAGNYLQAYCSIAIGSYAGACNQGATSIAVGFAAGNIGQSTNTIAIGRCAAYTGQGGSAVAIGYNAGKTTQGGSSVAVGVGAGQVTQGAQSVAVGSNAGNGAQSAGAVAVGFNAGTNTQGTCAVAVGPNAGQNNQSSNSISIGRQAGFLFQGSGAIAIGNGAGFSFQAAGSIAIGSSVSAPNAGLYISPIRSVCAAGGSPLAVGYCTSTKELVYNVSGGGGGISAGKSIAFTMILGA